MMKPAIQSLLAAAVVGSASTFAVAQQDPQLRVERQGADRAVITAGPSQQSQKMAGEARTMRDHSVRGTVVSLETYLRDGAEAARSADTSMMSPWSPKAILGDDGQVYLLLDAPMDRSVALDADGQPGTLEIQRGTAATSAGSDATTAAEARSDATATVQTSSAATGDDRRDVNVGTSAERNARETLSTDVDKDGAPDSGATRASSTLDGERDVIVGTSGERNARSVLSTDVDKDALPEDPDGDARTTRTSADADTQVYGMADSDAKAKKQESADKSHKHAKGDKDGMHAKHMKHLKIGDQVTLRGDVYERDNIRGIVIDDVQVQ